MVTNQSVEALPGVAGVRWYEIRRTGGSYSLYQQGTYPPGDGVHRWMGSVAMDKFGNIAAGYSVSNGVDVYPGIRYTGRLAGDPLGQMTLGEGIIINGSGVQTTTNSRWGDYTSPNVDPVDDCTFWYVSMKLHGRMQYGIERYRREHPEVDVLLIEPTRDDVRMFGYNIMRYSARRAVAEHAYRTTLEYFRRDAPRYRKLFARHGIPMADPRQVPEVPARHPHLSNLALALDSSLDRLESRLSPLDTRARRTGKAGSRSARGR